MSPVADDAGDDALGLRQRKKQRTRSLIIDAAVELFLRHGYDRTTVDQIAAAAEVSTRTFSRYFPTKESVVAAVAADLDDLVAEALELQPRDITEYEALARAHLELCEPDGSRTPSAFNQMAVVIQILNSSPTLTTASLGHQSAAGQVQIGDGPAHGPAGGPSRGAPCGCRVDLTDRVGVFRHGTAGKRSD